VLWPLWLAGATLLLSGFWIWRALKKRDEAA
jgi:hypothetical protein